MILKQSIRCWEGSRRLDFTDQYNTPLTPEEEKAFQAWANQSGRLQDLYDYDVRGWWKSTGGQVDARGHGTDQFKKPNHPTFSTESQYHGKAGLQGGSWDQAPGGQWIFTPGKTNQEMWEPQALQNYFQRAEPGSVLNLSE